MAAEWGHGLKPHAITSTRNRGKPRNRLWYASTENTPFKGQAFLSSQYPGLMPLDVLANQSSHKTDRNTTVSSSSLKWFPCCVSHHRSRIISWVQLLVLTWHFQATMTSDNFTGLLAVPQRGLYTTQYLKVLFILSLQIENRKKCLHLKVRLPSVVLRFSQPVRPWVKISSDK